MDGRVNRRSFLKGVGLALLALAIPLRREASEESPWTTTSLRQLGQWSPLNEWPDFPIFTCAGMGSIPDLGDGFRGPG